MLTEVRNEREKTILAGVMAAVEDGHFFTVSSTRLKVEDMTCSEHSAILKAILDIESVGGTPDTVSVAIECRKSGTQLAGYISSIVGSNWTSPINLNMHIDQLIRETKADKIERAKTQNRLSAGAGVDLQTVAGDLAEQIASIEAEYGNPTDGLKTLAEYSEPLFNAADLRQPNPKAIFTHVSFIDNQIVSMLPGEYGVIAAYPSVGKSALALQIAMSRGMAGSKTGIFSLEMSAESIGNRALSFLACCDTRCLMRQPEKLPDDSRQKILAVEGAYLQITSNIFIDDRMQSNSDFLMAGVKKMAAAGADLVLVDYFQLMQGGKEENRSLQLAALSRTMKTAAKRFGIAIIVLSQFTKEAAKNNREPNIHDMRDTAALEQDCDMAWILHLLERNQAAGTDRIKFKLDKGRNVGVGHTTLIFHRRSQTFAEAMT